MVSVLRRLQYDDRIRVLILSARESAGEKVQGRIWAQLSSRFAGGVATRARALLRRRQDSSVTVITAGQLSFDTAGG
jgi:DNA-binding response OmpR family regulator